MTRKATDSNWATRYSVSCSDPQKCWMRPCMWAGVDKGTFVKGVGYTSYYDKPEHICCTRDQDGCPFPLPEPDPEHARCCFRPDYPVKRASKKLVVCKTCGAEAPAWAAVILNTLPTQPGVRCTHPLDRRVNLARDYFWCLECRGHWDHRPLPLEAPNMTAEEYDAALDAIFSPVKPR